MSVSTLDRLVGAIESSLLYMKENDMRPIGHRLFTGRGADIRELDHKLIERLLAASRLGSFLVTRRVFLSRCVVINPQATRMSFAVIVIGAIQLC